MVDDNLPEPLVPPDHDVSMLSDFRLNVDRLLASELVAVGTAEECWAAFMLWCRAWKQVPGGSLPNDDRILAGFSGAGSRWRKVRDVALHGFVLCSDGRFYHRFLCEEVKRAYKSHIANATRREGDRKRLSDWREKRARNAPATPTETPDETRFVAEEPKPEPKPNPKKERESARDAPASLGSLSQDLKDEWVVEAREARANSDLPPVNLKAEMAKYLAVKREPERGDFVRWALNARANGAADVEHDEAKRDRPTGPPPPIERRH